MILEQVDNKGTIGFRVEINGGILGNFSIYGGYTEDEGGIPGLYGDSSPVLRNGKYFLPWHVSAALTDNGSWESCWLKGKDPATIVAEILKMRALYQSPDWYSCVRYANALTGSYVY